MKVRASLRLGGLLVLGLSFAFSERVVKAEEDPLEETQKLLQDATRRAGVIQGDSRAQDADRQADAVVGGDAAKKEELYQISSEAFSSLEKQNGGDPQAMGQALLKAQQDPEGFFKTLSPENQAAIRAMARELEAQKKGTK
jgi:hypothetical protein